MIHPRAPAHVQPFVDALGLDDAVRFLLHFGGAELTISPNPRDGELVEVLGLDGARALADLAARTVLPRRIPTAKPWLARLLKSEGLSHAKIARKLHVSDVAVRRYVAGQNHAGEGPKTGSKDQLTLF